MDTMNPSSRELSPAAADTTAYRCPVEITLEAIGGQCKAVILWHLTHKTLRFSQLQRRLPAITQEMLPQQLRKLEAADLVHREVYAEVPPRVEYSLTPRGRTLEQLLTLMCRWGRDYQEGKAAEGQSTGSAGGG